MVTSADGRLAALKPDVALAPFRPGFKSSPSHLCDLEHII